MVIVKTHVSARSRHAFLKTWKCPDCRCIQNEEGLFILFVLYEELFRLSFAASKILSSLTKVVFCNRQCWNTKRSILRWSHVSNWAPSSDSETPPQIPFSLASSRTACKGGKTNWIWHLNKLNEKAQTRGNCLR